jgi:hypothetical protein
MTKIICKDKNEEYAVKELSMEVLISAVERKPSIMKDNNELIQEVFTLLVKH